MEMGLKHALFDEYLLHDTVYVALAGVTVLAAMWAYTQCFLVTAFTCMAVDFSLGTAYFLYTTVFRISFFPFMNVLTLTIAIGIGADDAFIYCKTWGAAKAEKNSGTLVKLVRDTLHHACLSMLVTSVTTAAAFFASCPVCRHGCAGELLFHGDVVARGSHRGREVVLLHVLPVRAPFGVYLPRLKRFWCCAPVCAALWLLHHSLSEGVRVFYDKLLPCVVIRLRWLWLLSLALVAADGAVAIFVHPRLRLPESPEFQLLSASHLFKRYDLDLKERFWFAKARNRDPFHQLPIHIIWGVLPVDTGDYLNPSNKGAVVFDSAIDVAEPPPQEWLLSFCKRLRAQSFHRSALGVLFSGCFIETLKSWMERRCVDSFKQTSGPNLTNARGARRVRAAVYEDVEGAVYKWFVDVRWRNIPVFGPMIEQKAKDLAFLLGRNDFRGGSGCLPRFKERHDIVGKAVTGESKAADLDSVEKWLEENWRHIAARYRVEDIFNADETALFWQMLPNKTVSWRQDKRRQGKQSSCVRAVGS
ncbi:hypothetical protein HPB51_028432 [Rhipicephalus microplus]|uniref:HTH CENPB-type domain-containing protein n=1 Tax=Rhipicephalus microplus TaxID=6941 RepID=A0A9J6CX27_RHIMP|nr:hypothetical protein HPB51_028432 [Rhipicephalus microplus]